MKINLDDDNVELVELTVDEARNPVEAVVEKIATGLDEAQAHVFTEAATEAYLIVKITK
jgi:hypothetical protein